MSAGKHGFGLQQLKQAVLNGISSEGVSDANKDSLSKALCLLRNLETIILSGENPAVRVSQLLGLLGIKSGKRGVHFQRDELLVELVVFMTLERGLDKPDARLFQEAGHHAGVLHERSVEKIWTDLDGPNGLTSYRAQAKGDKPHWTRDKAVIREQIRLITALLSKVAQR